MQRAHQSTEMANKYWRGQTMSDDARTTSYTAGAEVEQAKVLAAEIDQLLANLDAQQAQFADAIAKVAPSHAFGARNLVDYAYLRTRDLSELQDSLSDLGATRLTTAEPDVRSRLKAARNILGAIIGEGFVYPYSEVAGAFALADEVLEHHATTLLGAGGQEAHSRIMVTLPSEAADDLDLVRGFVESGMQLARINCAHDDETVWAKMIDNVHTAAAEAGASIKVSMDLAGPKLRTGEITPGPQVARARVQRNEAGQVIANAKLWMYPEGQPSQPPAGLPGRPALPVGVKPDWYKELELGSEIRFYDNRGSRRSFTVSRIDADGILAEGVKNAYVAEGTLFEHDYLRTRATGIAHTERRLRLFPGQEVFLSGEVDVADPDQPGPLRIPFSLPEIIPAIKPGERVLFDDGRIAAKVVDSHQTEVKLVVTRAADSGTTLAANKGINLPDSDLPLPSLTPLDLQHLEFVKAHADIAAISFIRNAGDVAAVIDAMGGPEGADTHNTGLVLKIETIPAYENIREVLLEGMRYQNLGIMIARGDLAVELGFERMGEVPRLISALAEAGHVPTILATQVLETMAKSGLPSRAEITDAAYALRAECVMLNKGPHINETIGVLSYLNRKMGRSQRKNRILLRKIRSWAK